ncbi:choice-of-anchor A family protein [Microbacterium jejuense]|uniref:Choice-of-anchor A family protein n=1 Tax=Microbacterium jejuense TaxID=1263637 RepID=A0ABS7HQA6_9MICO|nr:DUF5979 domain-containing protein [Microbacterium jejuense]MBW9094858.1 choice-of-anchor A family protein [Microbacterium jejuense]
MSTTDRPRLRRFLAAALSTALAATGAVAVTALPASAAYPDSVNPFAIAGGFTVYAREDALLQNQETEGSIAVGGTATVQGSSGTYSIIHVSAGTGNYDLPTVDGDPTRFLVGEYSTDSTGILAITSAGTADPALWGDLKMVQRDGPWQPFARSDWIRLNENPSNPDQTPLIDAVHQQYPESAAPPSGATGGGSIYTADTSSTAVADYVEANRQASWDDAAACFADIADPVGGIGYEVAVAEDAGDRVVLGPLSADQPNVLDYSLLGGATLIQFSPGSPTPGTANPLVIRVPSGTTTVTGARIDPQGQYAPYVVWDLSQLTGDVEVTAGQTRMDGSIYAPDASVTVTAAPLDGQVIGRDVTIRGGEVHSYLFAGDIPCNAVNGTFTVRKQLSGIEEADLPEGTTFTVNYRAVDPDGEVSVGSLEVPADGSPLDAGELFPVGTVITFEEIEPESVPGWEWGDATITPNPLTIGEGTADVVVSNTATQLTGTFSVRKSIDFLGGDPVDVPAGATVPVQWTAWDGITQIDEGTLNVPLDGTVVDVGIPFPVGTRIVLTEDLSGVTPPDGYEWSGVGWDPGRTFVIGDDGTVAVELTNAVTPVDAERTITIVKSATGDAADPAYGYAVSYNTDPPGTRTTMGLPLGDPQPIADVEAGADTLELAELVPTLNGDPVDPAAWELPVIDVTVDGVTTTYRPENFEGAGPLDSAIVDIPLPEAGDISIQVTNALREGTFTLSKAFEGVPADQVPPGLEFTVAWTATLPTGEVRTGTLRLPGDGTAVGPVDGSGEPMLFPYGTVITYAELAPPAIRSLTWLGARFSAAQLVIGEDDQAVVHATLTNDVSLLTGTFLVRKDLAGIDPDELLTDSFTIDYVAHEPDLTVTAGRFTIPADGTPAGPVDESGATITFPIGTTVHLVEETPDASLLPPGYTWSGTTWTPGSSVVVGLGATPVLEVTNSVVALTRWAVTKVVAGDGAASVPEGTTFPVDWWIDGEQQTRVELEPNVTLYSSYYPVSTIIEAQEVAPAPVDGIDWGTPTWSVGGETLTPDTRGRVTLPMSETSTPLTAELTLTNVADAPQPPTPLPATGGGAVSPLVPLGALTAIALGAFLTIRRTRHAQRM